MKITGGGKMLRAWFAGLALALLWPSVAWAEVDLRWSGRVQTDIRFRVEEKTQGEWYREFELPKGVARNENLFNLKLEAVSDRWAGVADIDFVWLGVPAEVDGVDELSLRRNTDPWRLETQALYIEAFDIFFEGFDLRIGQQKIFWGAGDQFNPTHNLNAEDLEDPLLFGDQQANVMVRADYTPWNFLTFTGVLVPVFKPALLPSSAPLQTAAVDRLPFLDETVRARIATEQAFTATQFKHPTVVDRADPDLPDLSFENMQWSFAVRAMAGLHDIGVSYYNGRSDLPVPYQNITSQDSEPRFRDPASEETSCGSGDPDCIRGLLETHTSLTYPRIQVIGLNMSGPLPLLSWISDAIAPFGYRAEVGLYLPERQRLRIVQDDIDFGLVSQDGEYDYGTDADGNPNPPPEVVSSDPFLKWTLGLDYSFGQHVYVNLQWVHGMVDDFGQGDWLLGGDRAVRASGVDDSWVDTGGECAELRIQEQIGLATREEFNACARKAQHEITRPKIPDYIVLGADFTFLNQDLLFRLFTIVDVSGVEETRWDPDAEKRVTKKHGPFTKEGYSLVVFPQLSYNFGAGLELSAGAIFKLGRDYTKFGDPAAGGSLAWTQAKYSF